MAAITTYNALVALVRGLKPGDTLTLGPSDVAPAMLAHYVDLSLATTVTVERSEIGTGPDIVTVEGTASLFGLSDLATTLVFRPVDAKATGGPFSLAITTRPATDTQWTLLPGFVLCGPALSFAPAEEVELLAAGISCDIAIGTGDALNLPVAVTVPPYPGLDWVVSGTFTDQPLSADAFSALSGGLALSEYLPSPLDALAKFGMTELELSFDPANAKLSYVFMDIAYGGAWSALGIISVPAGGVTLKFMVDFLDDARSFVELEAKFEIAQVPVDIGAHFAPDNFNVWGRLREGESVAIADVFSHFDVALPAGFPDVQIDTLSLFADLSQGAYTFDLVALIDAGSSLKVQDLTVRIAVSTQPATAISGDFNGTIVIDEATSLFLGAAYDGKGGGLTLAGNAENIPIGKVVTYWGEAFGLSPDQIPQPIRTLVLETLSTSYDTRSGDFHFLCIGGFTVYDTPVEVSFSVDIVHPDSPRALRVASDAVQTAKGYSATFGGTVVFADNTFDIRFNTTDTRQSIFIADYKRSNGSVRLHDLVADVSPALGALVPTDIEITLDAVKFAYLEAVDQGKSEPTRHFLFGLELGASIGLTGIPLIGDKLPPDLSVAFDQLQFAYAKPGFDAKQASAVNALLPPGIVPVPGEGLAEGILVSSNLQLGDTTKPLSLQIPTGGSKVSALDDADMHDAEDTVDMRAVFADAPTPPASLSINIQKRFGPLGIRKLGLSYEKQRLFVTGDISLDAEVLGIGLLGLGIGSRVDSFDPAVALSGLTVTVAEGPVKVDGGLYGTIDPLAFNGALQLSVPSLALGALGGYAQRGPDPSFFMYVSVNRPLFGYPFFFLDGIAGGLGFNRDLLLPEIDGVAQFPLVAWATGQSPPGADPAGDIGSQVQEVIGALARDIPPRVGQYWIAAGIRFSSFKVLDSFALVTVSFGTDFKFALLGLTTASLPPKAGKGIQPIGYVEMALRASFSPATGILEIEAKLTPASFILDKKCVLTGGFAYYMWFKDNPAGAPDGYHAGDFVVTLGGYNPAFSVPSYYPRVPRLGFNWKVDGNTTIRGGIYFAITPSALMAGGALEAVWQSGDLKAWFTAHADFLLSWKPFHYEARIGLSIGASYKLDLLFTSVTISVHIGVELDLWGPPFGGSIHVDLTVISFTVAIGNRTKPKARPISWSEFKTSFLPQGDAPHAGSLALRSSVETQSYCLASVASGLVKDLTDHKASPADPDWIVSGETLEIVTMTALPSKAASLTTAATKTVALPVGASQFGVGPVGIAVEDFTSTHAITINRIVDGTPDPNFDIAATATVTLTTSNLPSATWGGKLVVNPSISQINNSPANIADLGVGYSIKARAPVPDHTPLPIDIGILQQDNSGTVTFSWLTPEIPKTDPFDQSEAMATFQRTLLSSAPKRTDILDVLNGPGLDLGVWDEVDVAVLAADADKVLSSPPVLSCLGEERRA